MLLFIRVWVWINRRSCISFNTSHVTLYRKSIYRNWNISFVSIHLMLLFINDRPPEITYWCWVSIHLMLLFITSLWPVSLRIWSFNTSHVTLYQGWCSCYICLPCVFQYISCYSLSSENFQYFTNAHVSIHLMLLFIDLDSMVNRVYI